MNIHWDMHFDNIVQLLFVSSPIDLITLFFPDVSLNMPPAALEAYLILKSFVFIPVYVCLFKNSALHEKFPWYFNSCLFLCSSIVCITCLLILLFAFLWLLWQWFLFYWMISSILTSKNAMQWWICWVFWNLSLA